MSNQFTLLSYNIHKGFSRYNRRYMIPDLRQALRHLDADFLCLQEVQGKHKWRRFKKLPFLPDISDHEFLAKTHWPYHAYGQNATYKEGHHGNAILSKQHLLKTENIDVSKYTKASRSLLHTEVKLNDTKLHIICVHLGLFKQERMTQYERLAKRMHNFVPDNAPLIIAGDFNDWRGHAEDILEKELKLQEAMNIISGSYAKTFPAYRPTLRVDRIYCRGVKILEAKVLAGKPWRYLSDHLPLLAKFEVL